MVDQYTNNELFLYLKRLIEQYEKHKTSTTNDKEFNRLGKLFTIISIRKVFKKIEITRRTPLIIHHKQFLLL